MTCADSFFSFNRVMTRALSASRSFVSFCVFCVIAFSGIGTTPTWTVQDNNRKSNTQKYAKNADSLISGSNAGRFAQARQRTRDPLLRAFSVVLRVLRVKSWRSSNGPGVRISPFVGTSCFVRTGRLLLALLLLSTASPCFAVEPGEQLKNPALEARARAISAGLRCLVCQNETIDESGASLAHDIRILLRERLTAGDTDEQAVQAIVDRYGEFVLLNPPVRPETYVLWFGPFGILLIGLLGGGVWLHRRRTMTEAAAPLNQDEQTRLDAILHEADR